MGRPPGPEKSFQKPSAQARPGSLMPLLPLSVTQVPRLRQGPLETVHDTAPGLREHSQLTKCYLIEPTQSALPKTAPAKTAELNGAASPAQ